MASTPSPLYRALNRVTFGATPGLRDTVAAQGWKDWVLAQLYPSGPDAGLGSRVAALCEKTPASADQCPLDYGVALLTMQEAKDTPYFQLISATWLRNAYSDFQIREVLADFWANHFSVYAGEARIPQNLLVHFDREVIRRHATGNFLDLLSAVAASPSMLLYLNNADSTRATPNENYARELLELHTLGGASYTAGIYTDADVVEVSKAFSGWTVKRGHDQTSLNTYAFYFDDSLHNPDAGDILGVKMKMYQGEAQGRAVLECLARHDATARFVAKKLCQHIFGEDVDQKVVDRAVAAWHKCNNDKDQIAKVMEAILLGGQEIFTAPAVKVRRPYEMLMAFIRACELEIVPNNSLREFFMDFRDGAFVWPTPEGRPSGNAYWSNPAMQIEIWRLFNNGANQTYFKRDLSKISGLGVPVKPVTEDALVNLVELWTERLLGQELPGALKTKLVTFARRGAILTRDHETAEYWLTTLVAMIAMTPQFGLR